MNKQIIAELDFLKVFAKHFTERTGSMCGFDNLVENTLISAGQISEEGLREFMAIAKYEQDIEMKNRQLISMQASIELLKKEISSLKNQTSYNKSDTDRDPCSKSVLKYKSSPC